MTKQQVDKNERMDRLCEALVKVCECGAPHPEEALACLLQVARALIHGTSRDGDVEKILEDSARFLVDPAAFAATQTVSH